MGNWCGRSSGRSSHDSEVHFLGICGDLPTNKDLLETFDKILKDQPLQRRGWEMEAW